MKSSSPVGSRWHRLLVWLAMLSVGPLLAGCNAPSHRPASSLSEHQRAVLDAYEQMRAGLAKDNPRVTKTAALALLAELKKSAASPSSKQLQDETQTVVDARALDSMRQSFMVVSESLLPLAEGVDGYYIMTSPSGFTGDWIQRSPEVDNPYFGRVMANAGSLKK